MLGSVFGHSAHASAEARRWVERGATLLDVRSREEFGDAHLHGAVCVPVDELQARSHELPRGRVVVYCRSGSRSAYAARILDARGYEVLDLGAMSNW